MVFAVILAGGVGSRMGHDIPKQYICVEGKSILTYTLERFQACEMVDQIVVVADPVWRADIQCWLEQYGISKFLSFADPGNTRQESIFSGLTCCKAYSKNDNDIVLTHDAARALVSTKLIADIIRGLEGYDACIPVLPLNDSIIFSETGERIDALLDRSKLFCGQSPEGFYLKPYWELNNNTPTDVLASMRADHELCFHNRWRVHNLPGEANNFKLTTPADIDRMVSLLNRGNA